MMSSLVQFIGSKKRVSNPNIQNAPECTKYIVSSLSAALPKISEKQKNEKTEKHKNEKERMGETRRDGTEREKKKWEKEFVPLDRILEVRNTITVKVSENEC